MTEFMTIPLIWHLQ